MSDRPAHSDHDLASYLLDELGEDERRAFEHVLAADPALAREADDLRRLVTRLDRVENEAWELPEPPPLRLEARESSDASSVASHRRRPAREGLGRLLGRLVGGSLQLRPALAAGLLALVFAGGLGTGIQLAGDSSDDSGGGASLRSATLQPVGILEPAGGGEAQLKDAGRTMRIRVRGLSANSRNDFYEAWMMDAEQGLVSIGSFTVGQDGSAEIDVRVPVDPEAFPVVDISLEPSDGAPAHSGKSVLRAELS